MCTKLGFKETSAIITGLRRLFTSPQALIRCKELQMVFLGRLDKVRVVRGNEDDKGTTSRIEATIRLETCSSLLQVHFGPMLRPLESHGSHSKSRLNMKRGNSGHVNS